MSRDILIDGEDVNFIIQEELGFLQLIAETKNIHEIIKLDYNIARELGEALLELSRI